jgi:AcrR family transcriptional regulator
MSDEGFAYSTGGEMRPVGSKGAATRDHIIKVTIDMLEETRLKDLRVADIAREAKVAKATFYTYFKDVTDVVLAALSLTTQVPDDILELFAKEWTQENSRNYAREFATRYINEWQKERTLFRIRNLAAEEGDFRFIQCRRDSVVKLLDAMTEQMEKRQREGGLPADLKPISVAGALVAMIERVSAIWGTHLFDENRPEAVHGFVRIRNEEMLEATAYVIASTIASGGKK